MAGAKQTRGFGTGFTDVAIQQTGEHEVRYTSGKTIYVEALIRGQWVDRCWAVDGRIPPYRRIAEPSFEIQIKNDPSAQEGTLLLKGWQWVSAGELPRIKSGIRHFAVEFSNKNYPINVKVHTLLDGTPVLTRWLEITNKSSKPIALSAVAPWSGRLWLSDAPITLGHSTRWNVPWEGWFSWTPLKPGANVFKNDKGLVWDDPYFVLRNESNGQYFFGQLAWPVNYRMEFEMKKGLSFKIGPSAVNELRVMSPGEMVKAPTVHLGYVKEGFDNVVQAMHDHIRRSVLPKWKRKKSYLVQYLLPEDQPLTVYRGDDYNETNVKKCMDVAAAVGIEVFIVDGPTWAEGTIPSSFQPGFYGNWVPRKRWFPHGFRPLVEYAHKKGLLFGVYAEIEGGRGDWSQTEAFKKHPRWFVPRSQDFPGPNFLNISIPETAAYMESELTQIIERHNIDLYRHDQNGCFGNEGSVTRRHGFIENDYWRHYEAFYEISERIHKKYPDIILQQASGGGSRLELATLARWHENYASDRVSYPHVYQMLSGLSVYLPPEVLVVPHGMNGPNQPDFVTMLRGAYTLGNTPMFFNAMLPKSVEEFKPGVQEKFLHYSNIYKTFVRPLLPTCRVYHHAPVNATGGVESGYWFAMEFAEPDRKKVWVVIIHLLKTDSDAYLFKPRGLDEGKRYSVTFDNTGRVETFQGSNLIRDGLLIQIKTEPVSELLLFEAR